MRTSNSWVTKSAWLNVYSILFKWSIWPQYFSEALCFHLNKLMSFFSSHVSLKFSLVFWAIIFPLPVSHWQSSVHSPQGRRTCEWSAMWYAALLPANGWLHCIYSIRKYILQGVWLHERQFSWLFLLFRLLCGSFVRRFHLLLGLFTESLVVSMCVLLFRFSCFSAT